MTVTQVSRLIRDALAQGLPRQVRLVGEVSNLSQRHHWFFSLKDDSATLRCVCFASSARRIRCPVQDGMEVVVTGRVDYYDQQGHVQLYVDKLEPVGQGALELKLRQLIDRLRQEGYFDEQRKRPMPLLPRRVAVVTSRSAAALQDFINTTQSRWPGCRLLLYDVRVQGDAAAPGVAAALHAIGRHGEKFGIDAVVVTRGGGSIEDLWAFNERAVADAIYHCPLPVVAAIGHETDTTVAELVADVRCSTPTQAAMRLIPDLDALEQQIGHAHHRLGQAVRRMLRHERQRLGACATRPCLARPGALVEEARRRLEEQGRSLARVVPARLEPGRRQLDHLLGRLRAALPRRVAAADQAAGALEQRLVRLGPRLLREPAERLGAVEGALRASAGRLLKQRRTDLKAMARQLEAVAPQRVLDRGFSYTLGPDGQVLRQAGDVSGGESITTVLAEGKVVSRVEPTGSAPRAKTSPKRRRGQPAPVSEQGGLFG